MTNKKYNSATGYSRIAIVTGAILRHWGTTTIPSFLGHKGLVLWPKH